VEALTARLFSQCKLTASSHQPLVVTDKVFHFKSHSMLYQNDQISTGVSRFKTNVKDKPEMERVTNDD